MEATELRDDKQKQKQKRTNERKDNEKKRQKPIDRTCWILPIFSFSSVTSCRSDWFWMCFSRSTST
jgi:hypothetical protein